MTRSKLPYALFAAASVAFVMSTPEANGPSFIAGIVAGWFSVLILNDM